MPHKFFNAQYGAPLRGLIAEGKHLAEVVHFGDQQVFAGATTYTCLLFLEKEARQAFHFVKAHDLARWRQGEPQMEGELPVETVTAGEWNFAVGQGADPFERLKVMPVKLGDLAHIFVGTQTSADTVFVLEDAEFEGNLVAGICKLTETRVEIEAGIMKPFLRGKDIRRYQPPSATSALICPYVIRDNSFNLMPETELASDFPLAYRYLRSHKSTLEARERGKFKGPNWYAFGYPKSMILFQRQKIIVPDFNNVASFTLDEYSHFYKTGYGILLGQGVTESALYVLGLINSPLLFRYLTRVGTMLRGGYVRFWTQYIEQLPIRTIDFTNPADVARHDRMVSLVERMLDLHKRLAAEQTPHVKTVLQRQIEATDRQIDVLVYELYGLTEEEIAVVEAAR